MIRLTDEERLIERERGREEGLTRGREEGLTRGREEGLTEGKKKKAVEIAVNLINMNMSLASISQVTGLSKEEIESL
ncbi:hypothetical protein IMSAG049_01666 [Clostridiales bacterium]|nr:hypothetical protein IMSAG049_01666 [Clostridiales bacterium]